MRNFVIGLVVLLIAAAIVLPQTFFTVDQTQFAIVTRFGAYQRTISKPGLYVKTPFAEKVVKFDNRLLLYDAEPASLLTADKRNLVIDAYALYRIVDPLKFFQTLRDEQVAGPRVGDIIASQLRREVALDNQSDIISTSRAQIMQKVRDASNEAEITRDQALAKPGGILSPEVQVFVTSATTTVPGVTYGPTGRPATPAELQALQSSPNPPILAGMKIQYFEPLKEELGVEIVDVRIKRADFPADIASSIYGRMKAERERIASGLRAQGAQSSTEIRANVDREVNVILQNADGEAAKIRGEGQNQAAQILAKSLQKDPEFYNFVRSLEAYQKIIGSNTTLILSSDSPLFKYLQSPYGKPSAKSTSTPLILGTATPKQ